MRVVIVGAGICGLVAGRRLADSDADVVLVDKGRSVGGRLATRRIGDATVDHGAQFFTVRTPAFQRQVDDWVDRGLATPQPRPHVHAHVGVQPRQEARHHPVERVLVTGGRAALQVLESFGHIRILAR